MRRPETRERDLESYRDIADDVIESDFVPYACLYNHDTIATKNGEVLQIIKITGLGFDAQSQGDLRASIRAAIKDRIPDTSYAIWLHTLRRKQSLLTHAHFPDKFSGELDALWRTQHPVDSSYVNELYVTVVKAAQQADLTNIQAILQSLWPPLDRKQRTQFIDGAVKELSETTGSMLAVLRPFGARLLTAVERDGVFYGEHLEFLEKLINLESRPMPIPRRDLSQILTSGDISFSHNAMEVRTAEGHRRFASILTIKEHKESTLAGIDRFLEIPCELIVTQCFDFVGANRARSYYNRQARYLEISGDAELAKWVEIDRLTSRNTMGEKSFGEQQTSLFLIAPSVKQLETNVRMVQKSLARLGIIVIREDLRFEDCYWAQLPGNFPFIARKYSVDTGHLAGFANLQRQPMGNAKGSDWGAPVALFSTAEDTPYFYNFHRDNVAHTTILGNRRASSTLLAHFLLAQSRKLNPTIWYLDTRGQAESFIMAMGGNYLTPGTPALRLNPFALEGTQANREFLALWLSTLIDPYGRQLTAGTLGFFQQMIDTLYTLPPSERRLSALIPIVRENDAMLAASLQRWTAGGEYGELFDMPTDQFSALPLVAWNLSPWLGNDAALIPLAGYLLHRLTTALAGQPTIIVLDEGFHLLKTPLFGPRAGPWLDFLTQNNAATMFVTDHVVGSAAYHFTHIVSSKMASIFALPEDEPDGTYAAFAFSEQEQGALAYMKPQAHHVLMKRGAESTLLAINLEALGGPILTTLRGKKPSPKPTSATMPAPLRAGAAG